MNLKVSVLVPIYKVSDFIEKCAESLFNQTFEDLEYIFVNDATPDNSIEILLKTLEKFPKRKDQVQIIHHEFNRGLAAARNTALDASRGKYIAIVDSDDYIESDMIEKLYKKATEENADLVIMDYIIENVEGPMVISEYVSEVSSQTFHDFIVNDSFTTVLWNKLILRSLYANPLCRVPEGLNFMEDKHVVSRLFFYATKIVKLEGVFYHYIKYNDNAITNKIVKMHFENVVTFWNLFDEFLKEHNEYEKYKPYLALPKIQSKVRLMIGTNSASLRIEYAEIFAEEELVCIKSFRRGERIMLWLIRNKHFDLAQWFHDLLVWKNKSHHK
jgi:glycosyltransferase involved in cell wall biosynthesis